MLSDFRGMEGEYVKTKKVNRPQERGKGIFRLEVIFVAHYLAEGEDLVLIPEEWTLLQTRCHVFKIVENSDRIWRFLE